VRSIGEAARLEVSGERTLAAHVENESTGLRPGLPGITKRSEAGARQKRSTDYEHIGRRFLLQFFCECFWNLAVKPRRREKDLRGTPVGSLRLLSKDATDLSKEIQKNGRPRIARETSPFGHRLGLASLVDGTVPPLPIGAVVVSGMVYFLRAFR